MAMVLEEQTIFISYSRDDEEWLDRLLAHLRVFSLEGRFSIWSDSTIAPGVDWRAEIKEAIGSAGVAIALISANSLSSEFIRNSELPDLLAERSRRGLTVILLILAPCGWRELPLLERLQVRPRDGTPLSAKSRHDIEESLAAVASEVATLFTRRQAESKDASSSPPSALTEIVVTIPSLKEENVDLFIDQVDAHLTDLGYSAEKKGDVGTVIRELAHNAIEHGLGSDTEATITLGADVGTKFCRVMVTDQGPGFNLRRTLAKLGAAEPTRKRGRGLLIVKALAERVKTNWAGNSVVATVFRDRPAPQELGTDIWRVRIAENGIARIAVRSPMLFKGRWFWSPVAGLQFVDQFKIATSEVQLARTILVDVADVNFFDSPGVSILVEMLEVCEEASKLTAFWVSPETYRLVYLVGLAAVGSFFPTESEAVEFLGK